MLVSLAPLTAEAVTAREILELSRAGLGDEVLLALIEVDGGVFTLDTATLTSLKQAGVSERVILAMVRSGRTPPADAPAPAMGPESLQPQPIVVAPEPQVIVIEHERPVVVQQVAVPVPVFVPVIRRGVFHNRSRRVLHQQQPFDPSPGFGAPFPHPQQSVIPVKREPVYWGWGGKLRPDAWQPDTHSGRSDHGQPRKAGKK
jgi:hypothetical protein